MGTPARKTSAERPARRLLTLAADSRARGRAFCGHVLVSDTISCQVAFAPKVEHLTSAWLSRFGTWRARLSICTHAVSLSGCPGGFTNGRFWPRWQARSRSRSPGSSFGSRTSRRRPAPSSAASTRCPCSGRWPGSRTGATAPGRCASARSPGSPGSSSRSTSSPGTRASRR